MRITALCDFAFWSLAYGRLERSKGQTCDIDDETARQAIANGWAVEAVERVPDKSAADVTAGAPGRRKAAIAGAPKKG